MVVKGIAFDFGDVLGKVDYKFIGQRYNELFGVDSNQVLLSLRKHGIPYADAQITEDKFWSNVAQDLGLSDIEQMKSVMTESFRPYQGTLNLARRLKPNYKLAILSNVPKRMLTYWEGKYFPDIFSCIVSSQEFGLSKRERKVYEELLSIMNLTAEETAYVDDTAEYVKVFRSLGGTGFVFKSAELLEQDFVKIGLKF